MFSFTSFSIIYFNLLIFIIINAIKRAEFAPTLAR